MWGGVGEYEVSRQRRAIIYFIFQNGHTMQRNCKKQLQPHTAAIPITAALRREGWKDPEFEASLGRVASSRPL